jgi:RNase P/RNase MRP subunit POP5
MKIVNLIKRRNSELFGYIATEKSSIKLIRSERMNTIIISCKLASMDNILSTIALIDPPLVTIDMSGTLKRLLRRLPSTATTIATGTTTAVLTYE